ncbi:unnamed protein product [Heterobilharzia americana]|nr:unnamed protein product [Heterobilharzia americana]
MKCIDPWLLCNRRRCPICNQVVELQGAPSVPVENETEVYNNELLRYLPRRLYNFIRRNSYERNDRRLSVDSQQSSGYYEAGGERTPLLSTDATTQHHACNDAGVHNSLLQPQFPETQSSFQVDDDDDELVDPKSPFDQIPVHLQLNLKVCLMICMMPSVSPVQPHQPIYFIILSLQVNQLTHRSVKTRMYLYILRR